MSDELDPSIAALLDEAEDYTGPIKSLSMDDFSDGNGDDSTPRKRSVHDVDLSLKSFAPIENPYLDTPGTQFNDPAYYKTALSGENASSQRVHQVLSKYLTCKDPKDRGIFRQQIVTCYWELLKGMAPKVMNINIPLPKKMLLRYGVLLPSLFRPEQKDFFSKVKIANETGEPIMYVDEWFQEIMSGRMKNSMTDESKQPRLANMTAEEQANAEQSRLMQLQSKNSGRLQNAENLLGIKKNERNMLEGELKNCLEILTHHEPVLGCAPHTQGFTDAQRKTMSEMADLMHRLSKNDKEYTKCLKEFQDAKEVFDSVQNKLGDTDVQVNVVDNQALEIEFDTVRQMAKMTIGRQGNQFPIFTREFCHCTEKGIGIRENVIAELSWIESIDPGAFCRIHKNVPNRIIPYTLLVPTYGDRGFCWEPFDKYNRVTSRARIVIPMYPRDLKIAVLTAVADLRWQVAKEKASYYWMEEGLTGQYYQHFEQNKLKGDVKEYFIEDYILWMTKESLGVQRLEKDVRGIFWRNMPFPKELKEDLRKRSLVYNELCQKDANREMSDGY